MVLIAAFAGAGVLLARAAGTELVVSAPIDRPDAIVVLASHEWERLPELATLAARYPAARVLLTRPAVVNKYNCHDCDARITMLARLGVAARRITVLQMTRAQDGTYGEAQATAAYRARMPFRRLLVVTSPYHTRRALATFRTVLGTDVQVGIDPAVRTSPARPDAWWRTPYDRWYVRYEWAAIGYYALRHQVLAF